MTAPAETTAKNTLVVADQQAAHVSLFASRAGFDEMIPVAKALASSDIVPAAYRGKAANCMVALELAHRTRTSVLMVMQNLHNIDGKPSWASAFVTAQINTCGRFSALRYQIEGQTAQVGWRCRAIARELETGDLLEGTWVTWDMALAEGWTTRKGTKWKTMPEQMIRYRAATFWARLFSPELLVGLQTADESEDIAPGAPRVRSAGASEINAALEIATEAVDVEAEVVAEVVAEDTPVTESDEEEIRRDDLETLRQEGAE